MATLKTIRKAVRVLTGACGAAFLILVYLLGSVDIESLHTLAHAEDQAQLHTAIQEADPCHVTVYHSQSAKGCDHKTHVKRDLRCSLCSVQLHNMHLAVEFTVSRSLADHTCRHDVSFISRTEGIASDLQGRAPPVV